MVTPLSWVQLGLRVDHRAHGHLSGCIHMGEHWDRAQACDVFVLLAVVTCNNQLSSLQCSGMSQGMAEATPWFLAVRKNEAVLLYSGRLSRRMDGSCAVPFAHRATEKVPTLISFLA